MVTGAGVILKTSSLTCLAVGAMRAHTDAGSHNEGAPRSSVMRFQNTGAAYKDGMCAGRHPCALAKSKLLAP